LEFAELSDTRVIIAFWISAVSTLLSVALLLEVIRMRILSIFSERRSLNFRKKAEDWLIRLIAGEKFEPPKIANRDLLDFLYLWIHFQEILRGESKQPLNQALSFFALESKIHKMMIRGGFEEQLIAATAMGRSVDKQAWDLLLVLLYKPSPLMSMTAARALVLIDAAKASDIVVPLIIQHRDWMPSRLVLMLKLADPLFQQAFLTRLEHEVEQSPPYLLRLMRLIGSVQLNQPLPLTEKFLTTSDDPNLIVASLRLVCHPSELELVRGRFNDENWAVQVQIAAVLGKMGMPQDTYHLLSLLNSKQWWVRYRATQALVGLPFINRRTLKRLIESRSDIFARDILLQVIAENARK
jgi:hypothetical protein